MEEKKISFSVGDLIVPAGENERGLYGIFIKVSRPGILIKWHCYGKVHGQDNWSHSATLKDIKEKKYIHYPVKSSS